jgi:hypothetical protein
MQPECETCEKTLGANTLVPYAARKLCFECPVSFFGSRFRVLSGVDGARSRAVRSCRRELGGQ